LTALFRQQSIGSRIAGPDHRRCRRPWRNFTATL